MQFTICVTQLTADITATEDVWQVDVVDEAGATLQASRRLRRVGSATTMFFPLPPATETAAIPAGAPHFDLCNSTTINTLFSIYGKIVARAPVGQDMLAFGRYLFATLMGDATWQTIQTRAAGVGAPVGVGAGGPPSSQPVDLVFDFPADDVTLHRLPWEMMHDGDRFVAERIDPRTAFVRAVAAAQGSIAELDAPPEVLFVVGSALTDPAIRPGAEYLPLMRTLEARGLALKSHLILAASPAQLREAVGKFTPTVLHLICHGDWDDQGGFLYFQPERESLSKDPVKVRAANLVQLLDPLPQVVVLNACYTAAASPVTGQVHPALAKLGQVAFPFAVQLVQKGVPVVAGMAGEVADQACRLYTRELYRSLLEGDNVAQAAAKGRRAGILALGGNPATTVDWTLPTLFVAENVNPSQLKIVPVPEEAQWQGAASQYVREDKHFCRRLDWLEKLDDLMADRADQVAVWGQKNGLQVFAVVTDLPPRPRGAAVGLQDAPPRQYGRSMLLETFASKAVRDGHVPLLVDKGAWPDPNTPPRTAQELVDAIRIAAGNTLSWFGIPDLPAFSAYDAAQERAGGQPLPANAPPKLVEADRARLPQADLEAWALRLDLLALLDRVRQLRPEAERPRSRLLLLVDDVHEMTPETVTWWLTRILGVRGLRHVDGTTAIRVVFTFTLQSDSASQFSVWRNSPQGQNGVMLELLDRFQPDDEALQAYAEFLLFWRENNKWVPLVPAGKDGLQSVVFQFLADQVNGVPSLLSSSEVKGAIRALRLTRNVIEAKDDDFLRRA